MTKKSNLYKKALKDKPNFKPPSGYKYLKDIPIGSLFETQSKMKGVLIDCIVNANVIITSAPNIDKEDRNFYLGKKLIASKTEVKEIK
jgi:NRPS condensation-like uncharacterized protein